MGIRQPGDQFSVDQGLFPCRVFAEGDQFFVVVIDGAGIFLFIRQVNGLIVGIDPQPGRTGRKAGPGSGGPLVGGAGIIPAVLFDQAQGFLFRQSRGQGDFVGIEGGNIIYFFNGGNRNILHAQLLPLIDPGQPPDQEVKGGQHLFGGIRKFPFGNIAADAPGLVMVLNDIGDKTDMSDLFLGLKDAVSVIVRRDIYAFMPAVVAVAEDGFREIEHGGKITVLTDEIGKLFRFFVKDFAYGKGLMGPEGFVPHFAQEIPDALCLVQHVVDGTEAVRPVRRVVVEGQGLFDIDDGVDPEAAQALVKPPVDHPVDLFPQTGIFPVEVGLLLMEDMQVVPVLVSRQFVPDGTAEIRTPVAGQLSVFDGPDIKIFPIFAIRILAGFFEPFMLVGAVIDDQIHDDVHIPFPGFLQQSVHVLHGAEPGIDIVIIRNIISLIRQRGTVDGGEPENVDAQIFEVIQAADDTGQIPDAVSVGIAEALGVNLISDFIVPPLSVHILSPMVF